MLLLPQIIDPTARDEFFNIRVWKEASIPWFLVPGSWFLAP